MRLAFRLAGPGDDAALRRLLARTPMPGRIAVTFEREPDFFAGMPIMGEGWQVLVAEDEEGGELAGMLCRASQERFVNGEPRRIGYWGQLRVAEGYKGRVFLRGALDFAARLGREGFVGMPHFAVISEDNDSALRLFGGRHRGTLPDFLPLARLVTLGLLLRSPRAPSPVRAGYEILGGGQVGLDAILRFLGEEGRAKQLSPVPHAGYFGDCGLGADDFLVALGRGGIQGLACLWDQSACKQTVVQAYAGGLAALRPFYNAAAPLLGFSPLPGRGQKLKSAYLSSIATRDNGQGPFEALLDAACRLAAERGLAQLLLGLSEADPLLEVARKRPHVSYLSRLSIVEEPGRAVPSFTSSLDGRLPYVEIAAL